MKLSFLEPKIDLQTKWSPAPHLTWEIRDGQAFIVDSQEGKVFHFNGVGAAIWAGIAEGLSGTQIAASISGSFEAPEKQILKDTAAFLSELRSQDLIVSAPGKLS